MQRYYRPAGIKLDDVRADRLITFVNYAGEKASIEDSDECSLKNDKCDGDIKLFAFQTYAVEPDEFIILCRSHEQILRRAGQGAFHVRKIVWETLKNAANNITSSEPDSDTAESESE